MNLCVVVGNCDVSALMCWAGFLCVRLEAAVIYQAENRICDKIRSTQLEQFCINWCLFSFLDKSKLFSLVWHEYISKFTPTFKKMMKRIEITIAGLATHCETEFHNTAWNSSTCSCHSCQSSVNVTIVRGLKGVQVKSRTNRGWTPMADLELILSEHPEMVKFNDAK